MKEAPCSSRRTRRRKFPPRNKDGDIIGIPGLYHRQLCWSDASVENNKAVYQGLSLVLWVWPDCPKTISCDSGSRDGSRWVLRFICKWGHSSKDLVKWQHLLRGAGKWKSPVVSVQFCRSTHAGNGTEDIKRPTNKMKKVRHTRVNPHVPDACHY